VQTAIRRWALAVSAVGFVATILLAPRGVAARVADDDLPDGEGKKILLSSCTSCHELSEVTKFRGYYNRAQWRDIVVTMMEYGAPIDEKQVDVLADYLVASLGKR
jgi:mono/diheme cytochrome c family protein